MAEIERSFLRFLIEASPAQAKAVLKLITPKQLSALGETCFNLVHADINTEIISDLRKYRTLIRKLSAKNLSSKDRAKLAAKHHKRIVAILQTAESILP